MYKIMAETAVNLRTSALFNFRATRQESAIQSVTITILTDGGN